MQQEQLRTAIIGLSSALLVLAQCARNGDDAAGGAPAPPTPPVEEPPLPAALQDRPQVRRDTILVEGMAEPIDVRLVRAPTSFPIPFSTYASTDFIVEPDDGAGSPAVRFIAAFCGRRNADAFLEVRAYSVGISEADAFARARRAATAGAGDEVELRVPERREYPWAAGEWDVSGRTGTGPVAGQLAVGRHGVRFLCSGLAHRLA